MPRSEFLGRAAEKLLPLVAAALQNCGGTWGPLEGGSTRVTGRPGPMAARMRCRGSFHWAATYSSNERLVAAAGGWWLVSSGEA